MKYLYSLFFVLTSLVANGASVDQRDPNYQSAIENLSAAHSALSIAIEQITQADAHYPLPGFDIVKIRGQLYPVQEFLELILMPEEKRLQGKELVPDSIFFTPIKLMEQPK